QRVREPARAGVVERLQRHECEPEHERARVPVLKLAAHDVPRRLLYAPQPAIAIWNLRKAVLQRGPPTDRRVAVAAERSLRLVVLVHHSAEGLRIAAGELRKLLARA